MKEKDFILEHDYCFYLDADMRIDALVGNEILGDLVATMHPYQSFYSNEEASYDRNPESLAYVPVGQEKPIMLVDLMVASLKYSWKYLHRSLIMYSLIKRKEYCTLA